MSGSVTDLLDVVHKIDPSAEVLADSSTADVKEWIHTGSYILNAALSGSLFKGVPSGRVTVFAGESGTGKSFLMNSVAREAQYMGYIPVIIDTENAIDNDFCRRLGIDTSKLIIKKCTTVSEMSNFVLGMCKQLEEMKAEERPKVLFILDSLSNLSSDAELENAETSNIHKQDFSKNKGLKAFFRTATTKLGVLGIPMLISAHVYLSIGSFFPTQQISGGEGLKYSASTILMLSAAKLDGEDKENDEAAKNTKADITKTGVRVTAKVDKSRFSIPTKVQFQIPFFKEINPYVGLEKFLTFENSGIGRGNTITEKEYEKLKGAEKESVKEFEYNGEKMYFKPSDRARGMVVAHLGCQVPFTEFYTSKVFTKELLARLDEEIIKPTFELPTHKSDLDIEEYLRD